ncbi:INTRON-ENCODED HOMING ENDONUCLEASE putative-RELATED [Salix koriyanagi]|uniref:INTRON-ENCODED HOMING ENDONUCLEASE putative-RELATED n=1 Tax=Salix koriyanagi TaxID=2511006 RepID=A0A9Q0W959_9ROSI|nr:INTRON-ENCODED HOMING ENDONUCLEASE putative-RELATED [Salix koriyanagi]
MREPGGWIRQPRGQPAVPVRRSPRGRRAAAVLACRHDNRKLSTPYQTREHSPPPPLSAPKMKHAARPGHRGPGGLEDPRGHWGPWPLALRALHAAALIPPLGARGPPPGSPMRNRPVAARASARDATSLPAPMVVTGDGELGCAPAASSLLSGDALLGLNWPGRASGAVTLKKLECSKQACALDTLAWDNIIGFRSYSGLVNVAFRTPPAPYEKSKFLGSGESMVARLKLKGIDGRAPPGVEPAA